ncbi:hypothetical protein N7492_003558 [Penicillium capsulatum]|uniref:Methyltransferase domain-containing protein n=1 Tax=Penicillium capsulatum TaxID=69766 RepID=A0A9W9ILI8_9EURO|nr:hypothetical protein N7492_003558 [Penicillium capsulatum]KAJ6121859.1 hypothetical protein N7512_004324 [Penicillium capsulatum]
MPRLPPSVLIRASRENGLLPALLKECRTLDSARNELRWLRERALRDSQSPSRRAGWRTRLRSMCHRRSRGVPLQYILGDQPFGDLEILCRPGVLIPRPETESYTYQAANLARQISVEAGLPSNASRGRKCLRVLDLCTGTGCIALLLHALLAPRFEELRILGIDLSPHAMSLARKNLDHNLHLGLLDHRASTDISFHRADVLGQNDRSIPSVEEILPQYFPASAASKTVPLGFEVDVLVSNPPYISTSDFRNGTTARSVRLFEPRLALVPPATVDSEMRTGRPEDIFYHHLLSLSRRAGASITVLECGDIKQARRVVDMYNAKVSRGFHAEIWPSSESDLRYYGFHPRDGSRCVIIRRHTSQEVLKST